MIRRVMAVCAALLSSACASSPSAKASCNLEPRNLPQLLQAIQPLIERGYGESEIKTLQQLFESTPLKKTGVKVFPISYQGKNTSLRVELKKDDVDEIEIWFITDDELAKEIQAKMRQLPG